MYKRWLRDQGGISAEDKEFVKQHVLEALVQARARPCFLRQRPRIHRADTPFSELQAPTSRVRDQLQEAMIFITKHEFPYHWEAFPGAIDGMMSSGVSPSDHCLSGASGVTHALHGAC